MLQQRITPEPTPAQVGQRSYTVANVPQADWSTRRGLDWSLRRYGQGHWIACHGEESLYATQEAAHAAGRHWNVTGKDEQATFALKDCGL